MRFVFNSNISLQLHIYYFIKHILDIIFYILCILVILHSIIIVAIDVLSSTGKGGVVKRSPQASVETVAATALEWILLFLIFCKYFCRSISACFSRASRRQRRAATRRCLSSLYLARLSQHSVSFFCSTCCLSTIRLQALQALRPFASSAFRVFVRLDSKSICFLLGASLTTCKCSESRCSCTFRWLSRRAAAAISFLSRHSRAGASLLRCCHFCNTSKNCFFPTLVLLPAG